MNIGFVGAGKMAKSLAQGFISAGITRAERITVSCPPADQALLDDMMEIGCNGSHSNPEVTSKSDVVFLAVKPHIMPLVLKDIHAVTTRKNLIMSVALGVSLRQLQSGLPEKSRVIRVMPNTPCMVQQGACVYCCGDHVLPQEDRQTASTLLKAVGICNEVPEQMMDAVTGVSGSGPAYMYIAVEALADGGVKMGLPRKLALDLAVQTMLGSAQMLKNTGRHPGELKDDVCSPGGSTIEAVSKLEMLGLRTTLMSAVEAAARKSTEIKGA